MSVQQLQTLWSAIIRSLAADIPRAMLLTWFKDTTALSVENDTLVVGLPLPMFLNWHLEHYKEMTLKAAQEADKRIQHIVYTVDISLKEDHARTVDIVGILPEKKRARKLPNKTEVQVAEGLRSKMFSPRYTLDSFVIGSSNRLAHAAAHAVVSEPGGKYNPFFVYGGVGLGKTHLLQAVGNGVLQSHPDAVVLYTTSEEFTNHVIEAIGNRKMDQLRRRYRQVDVLIIDDIQFFASKDRCQEEFFHTFNTLIEGGKQIVISSDRPPHDLHRVLQDRLCSRFQRGMVADVQVPDYETRMAILHERAREYELLLDQQVISYIAQHVTDSVRSLEGILMQAVAQYELEHRVPTLGSIESILHKLRADVDAPSDGALVAAPARKPKFEDVLESVSQYYSVSIQEMLGDSRVRHILLARQVAMYITNKHMKLSSVQLGARFSGRDHSTVLHAIKKIGNQIQCDQQLLREVRAIEQEVGLGV